MLGQLVSTKTENDRNMRKAIYILGLVIVISACGKTNSKTENKLKSTAADTTEKVINPARATVELTRLDSIEKANNKSVIESGDDITKAYVSLTDGDSTIYLTANIRQDHRIIGYATPDTKSERLLLLSLFTDDVEKNPFGCKLGAYYDTSGMGDLTLKYVSTTGNFVKAVAVGNGDTPTSIYFEKKWIEFE